MHAKSKAAGCCKKCSKLHRVVYHSLQAWIDNNNNDNDNNNNDDDG